MTGGRQLPFFVYVSNRLNQWVRLILLILLILLIHLIHLIHLILKGCSALNLPGELRIVLRKPRNRLRKV